MLTKIDDLTLPDHYRLDATDECYFVGEYTARAGYSYSATNDLVHNLKKPMDRKDRSEWRYKILAMATASTQLRNSLNPDYLRVATFIPVPLPEQRTTRSTTTECFKFFSNLAVMWMFESWSFNPKVTMPHMAQQSLGLVQMNSIRDI
jgi:hypothetical protein